MWEKRFGGSSDDQLTSIIQTSDGGFLIGGYTSSPVSGDKTSTCRGTCSSPDYWVIKLNALGNIEWNKTYGGDGYDLLQSVMETKDGYYVLAGKSDSNIGYDKSQHLGNDAWIIKIDSKGKKIWDKVFEPSNDRSIIKETNDGNYILGTSYSPGPGGNYWIIKIDTAGNKIWDKIYGNAYGDNSYCILSDIIQTPSGDYILSGISNTNSGGNKTASTYGGQDLWVLQVNDRDSIGDTIRWQNHYGGTADEFYNAKIRPLTSGKQYIITASSKSPISGNKSQGTYGDSDYWIVKIDSIGNKKWDRRYGGTNTDQMKDIEVDQDGYLWLAGDSQSDSTGNKTVTSYGNDDYWILKTREACTHDSVCFRWTDAPFTYTGDSATIDYKIFTCDSVNSEYVYNTIMLQVQQYIDSSLQAYQIQYIATCGNADSVKDTLSLSYPQGFYNYTLYYYDRAGNLVRTVPPQGVNYKDAAGVLVTSRLQHNAHTFVTNYKYNSLKQLVQQQTPDGGISNFWYDYKAQLRVSQNAQQKIDNKYSYSKYDNLGRIIEVGQSSDSITSFYKTWNLNNPTFPVNNKQERTYTVYTTGANNIYYIGNKAQRYLQNRVSYTYTDDNVYTYYSYDPHGNVEWLIQDLPELGKSFIRYEYDLISNKVLAVHYNEGAADEYHHRYTYDTDQRLLNAQTAWGQGAISSSINIQPQPMVVKQNNVGWDNDAKYKYYLHGPLKRAEIGEDHIQGIDYVYTINGWLKATNYPTLKSGDDPGKDNNKTFAADVFGMVLGYYSNDFNRTGSKYNPATASLVSSTGSGTGQPGVELYNGNISNWTLSPAPASAPTTPSNTGLMGFKYKYDQLNRLKTEDYRAKPSTTWTDPATTYDNKYTYDGNGNILTLYRDGNTGIMDNLTYKYENTANGYAANTNKLRHVLDPVANGAYTTDIDNQAANNYTYDAIGNLISDAQATINSIKWTVYGKIKSIKKSNNDSIIFTYDAAGNRVMKRNKPASGVGITTTYYVKDASGNALSLYERTTNGLNYEYRQKEATIYGSSRLGISTPDVLIRTVRTDGSSLSCLSCAKYYWTVDVQNANGYYTRDLHKKVYELSDHLGNVRATVYDRKLIDSTAELASFTSYYAGGMLMPGRNYTSANGYRYGFNGKENDNEVKGNGNSVDFGARIYDPRLGRFLSTDPLAYKYANLSPYHFCAGNPILFIDADGNDFFTYVKVQNEKTGQTEIQKVTFDGVSLTITDGAGNTKPLSSVNPASMNIADQQFVDDIVASYNYIVTNGADVDDAMKILANSKTIHVEVKNEKHGGDYLDNVINYDFRYGAEVSDRKGNFKGDQSPALGFWSEVYHAYIDLVDQKAKARYNYDNDAEEEYVHAKKERQVIDALKQAQKANQETKRNKYGDAGPGPKMRGATSTERRPKEGKKAKEPYVNPIRHL